MTLRTFLFLALGLLAIDAALEMALVSSTVAYLHSGVPSHKLAVVTPADWKDGFIDTATFDIAGKPEYLITNPGHLSNAAAGTALLLVAALGFVVHSHHPWFTGRLLCFWRLLLLPALILSVSALIFVFVEDRDHRHISYDLSMASFSYRPYVWNQWTPQAWFSNLLAQPLADAGVRASLKRFLRIVHGWMYNLIPMVVLQLVVFLAVIYER